ncbi:DUF2259 domain-containing protein [Devosia epidermidihirudinis]|uniref:DUF2259 domain-containing protein n=1 Tax=Devosia epidermidihirudinis TaxID=1293439 RepID=UPI0009E5539B|nr:DUF2259 domain-containing protein [Devosia epidermidihirudinis]
MQQNAAATASAQPVIARLHRICVLALALVLALAAPTLAGDRASLNVLGYSEDGDYFAFEEFGIQDGSGFAYANIYLIDIARDQWVKGTPIKVQAETEERSLAAVRAEATELFAPLQAKHAIGEPADLLAVIGDGVADNDGSELAFGAIGYMGPGSTQGAYQLKLDTFDIPANANCQPFEGDPLRGFALSLTEDGKTVELHRDTTLPASRRCTVTYRLYGVAVPFPGWSIERGVAIISAYSYGFEGPDRRFLVVPLGR